MKENGGPMERNETTNGTPCGTYGTLLTKLLNVVSFTLTSNTHKNIHKQTCTHKKITHMINQLQISSLHVTIQFEQLHEVGAKFFQYLFCQWMLDLLFLERQIHF